MYIYICTNMCIYIYRKIYVSTYIYIIRTKKVYVYVYIHIQMHTCIHSCTHTPTHTVHSHDHQDSRAHKDKYTHT